MRKNKGMGEQMKKIQFKKIHFQKVEFTKEGKQAVAGISVGIVVLALLAFFLLFKVDRVELWEVRNIQIRKSENMHYPVLSHPIPCLR